MYRKGLADYLRNFQNPLDISVVREKKIIYMRTPKTASSSIAMALWEAGLQLIRRKEQPHEFNTWLQNISDNQLKDYYIFSSVRNPWDRVVSTIAYSGHSMCRMSDLTENSVRLNKMPQTRHGIYQFKFTHLNKKKFVDDIIRFETLEEDTKRVAEKLGLKIVLGHHNQSNHRDYKSYYSNKQTIERIRYIYQDDVELFGYEFGD